jgi:hypothetical protein
VTTAALAIIVFLAFLLPVPLLAWLERPRDSDRR